MSIENEDAFREVLRQPARAPVAETIGEGRKKVKVVHARHFYNVLLEARGWCDGSEDCYFEVDDEKEEGAGEGAVGKDEMRNGGGESEVARGLDEVRGEAAAALENLEPLLPTKLPVSVGSLNTDINASVTDGHGEKLEAKQKQKKWMYTGYRHDSPAHLPASTRVALLRAFMKMAIHTFGLRDHDVARTEKLRVRDVEVPGYVCRGGGFVVAKVPKDRVEARKRRVEGPVMGARAVGESKWRVEGVEEGQDQGAVSDGFELCREVGGLVQLAVMRAREGVKGEEAEMAMQKDWWWAKKERWGGGEVKWGMRADEVYEEDDPSWSPQERERQDERRRG